ncbi:hypothetical protein M422DRAFT_183765, partial [Sphaerobolus stellatus SS14]
LDPAVKETLERKRFYLANYKEVKRDLLGQADCPAFPDSLWHDVIVGNFVDLDKVYTGRYSLEPDTEFTQTIGDIDFRIRGNSSTSKSSKEVRTHSEWTVAFHSAKSAILFLYPNRKEEFAAYEAFIIGQFAATRPEEHRRVITLDKAIRKEAAKVNNCTLTTVPSFNAFGTQYLNSIGLGANSPTSLGKRRRDDIQDTPICRRFNRDDCAGPCRFRHVCLLCKGRHQAKDCSSHKRPN